MRAPGLHLRKNRVVGPTQLRYSGRMIGVQEQETAAAEPFTQAAMDYARVERAIRFLNEHRLRQPGLDEIAAHVHLSPFHFERLFQRWAGTSPKRFLQCLTKEHAKALLRESRSVLDAAYEAGLSGPGRLHDLFVTCEAVTPGQFKQRGAGLTIRYGFHPTPYGECLVALTERGICALHFPGDGTHAKAVRELQADWSAARLVEDERATGEVCARLFGAGRTAKNKPFPLHLRGTNFQLQVWQALLKIPPGALVSYGDLAASIGSPKASRAVGSAVGANPIAYLIPCHRVIQSLGAFGHYSGGPLRKQAMIGREMLAARRGQG